MKSSHKIDILSPRVRPCVRTMQNHKGLLYDQQTDRTTGLTEQERIP
jgi:hypothetical protein